MWDQVAALAPQTEQVTPLVPEPMVVGNVNKEDFSNLSPLNFLKIIGVLWSVLFSIFGEG